jgi:lipopolysaccharide biosynthesis glycosyltransferase
MQLLPIVYASDNNQIDLLKISIFSALKNKADSTQYEFFILSRDIDYLHQLEIKKLCNIYHATINFIDCAPYEKKYHFTDEELKQLKVRVLLPSVTFYRLIIDEVVPFREKIIYIDNDTLILKDLTDLYNTTITTRYGMVKEVNHPIQRWTSKEGTVTDYCYNAGVMLINNNFPSTLSIEDMFKEVIKYRRHDQDFLNYFC